MAAPTALRVEAIGMTVTVLRWAGGTGAIGVYRSTDGVAYSLVQPNVDSTYTVIAGGLTFTDTGLTGGTRYWYKLSDDAGSTYSLAVSVVTYTCPSPADGPDTMALPRLAPGDDAASSFNELAEVLEVTLGDRVLNPTPCQVCSVNGAIVFDCGEGCHDFIVEVTEDINSVTIRNCDGEGVIQVVIPPNVDFGMCGFPPGSGFTGDECTQARVGGGSDGRTIEAAVKKNLFKMPPTKPGVGGGGGGGGGGCECITTGVGALTIKCCSQNCSLGCGAMPVPRLQLKACGGKPPYNWTHTGNVKFQTDLGNRSTDTDTKLNTNSVIVLPQVNPAPAVVGNAYAIQSNGTFDTAPVCNIDVSVKEEYGCNDQVTVACTNLDGSVCDNTGAPIVFYFNNVGVLSTCGYPGFSNWCSALYATRQFSCDRRTAPMIAAGCIPCGLSAGMTVSVTDALGTVATIILKK